MAISRTDYTMQAASKGYGNIEVGEKDDIRKDSNLKFKRGELETNTGEKLYNTGVNGVYELDRYGQNDQIVKSLQDTEGNIFTYVLDLNGESWKPEGEDGVTSGSYMGYHTDAEGETTLFTSGEYGITSGGEITLTSDQEAVDEKLKANADRDEELEANAIIGLGDMKLSEAGTIKLKNGATISGLGAEGDTVTVTETNEAGIYSVVTSSGNEIFVSANQTEHGLESQVMTQNADGTYKTVRYSPDSNRIVQEYVSLRSDLENTPFASINVGTVGLNPEGERPVDSTEDLSNV